MDSESIYAMHGPMGKFFKTLKWNCEVSISSQRIREVREIPVLNDELVIRALRIFNGLRSVFSLLYDWKWLQRPSCGRSNAKDEVVENGQFGQSIHRKRGIRQSLAHQRPLVDPQNAYLSAAIEPKPQDAVSLAIGVLHTS